MSKKVIKDEFVKSDKLKHFGFEVYATVELGEKTKKLEKVGEMEYTPGEINAKVESFDSDIEMGRAIVVQDRGKKTEKYAPKKFSEDDTVPINQKKEEPEPEPEPEEEPEPEIPAITEDDVKKAADEARKAGFNDGLNKGRMEGRAEAEKKYETEKADYIQKLDKTYEEVINGIRAFQDAVNQLDESLPGIIISMVKDIVGQERKINDEIVTSVAKKSLGYLRELEKVVFLVNPADVESMRASFPDYLTEPDKNVPKGSLKVSTNIGEMNFSIERMLAEFVDRIHEEFSQTEEG
jgi:flagellar assembly protein FliH